MNHPRLLPVLVLLLLALTRAGAVEYDTFRATVSLPFVNSTFQNDIDKFVNTRVGNKQLINLARGLAFKERVPANLVLAILVPKNASPFASPQLVLFNKETKTVVRTIATFTSSSVLVPDDLRKPAVGIVTAAFSAMANAEFNTSAFTLTSSGTALARVVPNGPLLTFDFARLHGTFSRSGLAPFYYAGVVAAARVRATGKPIATVNL